MVKMCQSKADIYPERALICLTAELKGKKNKTFTYLMDQKVLKTSILYDHNFFLNSRDLIDSSFCMLSCLVLSTFFLPYLPFTATFVCVGTITYLVLQNMERTPLHVAVEKGDINIVNILLHCEKINVDAPRSPDSKKNNLS